MIAPLLHVLGGGPWQLPTVRLAKELGVRILVTDCHAQRPAYAIADYHEVVDITDLEATLEIAKRYKIDGIICDTTDVGVPTAAYVAEHMHLAGPRYEVALNFTDKSRMRQIAQQAGLPVPTFQVVHQSQRADRLLSSISFPVLVKPVDNQSGKGVTKVTAQSSLVSAIAKALTHSRKQSVLIESAVEGEEIIVDGFMQDGYANILGIAKKIPHYLQPTVSKRITYGHRFGEPLMKQIQTINQLLLFSLGLRDGIFHAEYMVCGSDIVPIDIAARGGGCMIYTHVLPYISGVNANREMIMLALGRKPSICPDRSRAANIEFFDLPRGIIESWHGLDEVAKMPGVLGLHCNLKPGDAVPKLEAKDDRPGYIVTGGANAEEAIQLGLAAKSSLRIRMIDHPDEIPIS